MKELIKHIGKPQFSWFLVGGALFISVLYVREIINFWFAFGFAIVLVIVNERLEDYSKREEGVEKMEMIISDSYVEASIGGMKHPEDGMKYMKFRELLERKLSELKKEE